MSASTQNQALSALLFLYRRVLHIDLPWLEGLVRAKRPARLPFVLSRDEVAAVLAHLAGVRWLVAALLEDGYDIRTVQELLGHRDVRTTMVYTHVLNRGGRGVVSPVDRLVGTGSFPAGLGRDSPQPISAKRGVTDSPERVSSRPLPARVDPPSSVADRLLPQRSERS